MKRLACTLAIAMWFLFPTVSGAEDRYITDNFSITMRTGPGTDHKIISMLRSGQKVELLVPDEEWSRIALEDGTEGFVLNRFLVETPPSRLALQALNTRHATLTDQNNALLEENNRLKEENRRIGRELNEQTEAFARLNETHETLKRESADFFKLKRAYDLASADLTEKTERVETLESEVTRLRLNKNIKWFLSGAGVLIFGFIIGFSAKRQRRRSSLLS